MKTIAHPDFSRLRHKNIFKRRLRLFYMLSHMFMAFIFVTGYFYGYLMHYKNRQQRMLEKSSQGEFDPVIHKQIQDSVNGSIEVQKYSMGLMILMAAWAYVMAAYSNPGIVDFDTLVKYKSDDLNEKQVNMFKNVVKDDNDAEIADLFGESKTELSLSKKESKES